MSANVTSCCLTALHNNSSAAEEVLLQILFL